MNAITNVHPHAATNDGSGSNSPLPSPAGLNNMFLQLLVAQLQNQNPLDPMDPTQFVGQLAQFSELSEITQISELLQKNLPSSPPASTHPKTSSGASASEVLRDPAGSPDPNAVISSAVAAARNAASETNSSNPNPYNHAVQGVF